MKPTPDFPSMPTIVPEGQHGSAKVKHFTIDKGAADLFNLGCIFGGRGGERVTPGRYAKLIVDRTLVMSDTDMERRTNWAIKWHATGDVLIAGLGLGMILHPILQKPDVRTVTVIEQHPDVIALIEPTLHKARKKSTATLTIINADIFDWTPPKGAKYDAIYFDIWADISEDDLPAMAKLHQRFKRFKRAPGSVSEGGSYMDSWRRETLLARRSASYAGGW